jgi:ABC-2 type transport system permease protein
MTGPSSDSGERAGRPVALVVRREVRTRLASRTYQVTTALFVAAIVLGGVLVHFVGSSAGTQHVGVSPAAAPMAAQVQRLAQGIGLSVDTQVVPSTEAGQAMLRSGDLDALVTSTSPRLGVSVDTRLDPTLVPLFGALAQQVALVQAVTSLGGDPAQVMAQVNEATPDVAALRPAPAVDGAQVVAGYIAGILLFLALMTTGQLVAQGVVEEKSSRVVELLLATVRPWQLMAGKVLGIGLIGLLQVVLVIGAGVATALGLGLVQASSLNLGSTALWAVLWFVIGFASYALVLAALASLVSRQEEVASVIGPVTALMVVPYVVGISIAPFAPDNPLVAWMSYIPFCAPLVMPIRIALGAVAGWQILVSAALSVALIPLLVWLAGRVYATAVVHSGSKVRLSDALRGA